MSFHYFRHTYLILVLTVIFIGNLQALSIKRSLCEEFRNHDKIYIIDDDFNSKTFTSKKGEKFSFVSLVKKTWPKKEAILLSSKDYNKLDGVGQKFFITATIIKGVNYFKDSIRIGGAVVQKGSFGLSPFKVAVWINTNLDDIYKGILAERLIYAVQNAHDIIEGNPENYHNTLAYYKLNDLEDYLTENTLYIQKQKLSKKLLQNPEKIKKLYPYKIKIVSEEEWREAITGRLNGVLFADLIDGYGLDNKAVVQIFHANTGRLISNGYYVWARAEKLYDSYFFQKMF